MINKNGNSLSFIFLNKKEKIYALIISMVILILFSKDFNFANIPELQFYNNQTIKLLVPSKRCKFPSHKTLFLTSNCRNNTQQILKKYKIIEYKNKKTSFVTYYSDDKDYNQYKNLLLSQGIINSKNIYGDHNFYFSRNTNDLIKYNKSFLELNNFKKFDRLFNYKIFQKDSLYMSYKKMKKLFNREYNFMVETYNYPNDRDIINKKFKNYTFDINDLWLIKPKNKSGGHGIKILKSFDKLKKNEFLITKYITNLDFINHKKYDLRLYALITGLKPLRIYFYKEGLIRRATYNFSLDKDSIKNRYIHLTNIGVNKKNKDYIIPNKNNIESANLWNLKTFSNYLKNKNIEYENIRNKIKDIIIKSIISVYQKLLLDISNHNLNDINFYDVLGYDILIKDNYDPILLEINTGPTKTFYGDISYYFA